MSEFFARHNTDPKSPNLHIALGFSLVVLVVLGLGMSAVVQLFLLSADVKRLHDHPFAVSNAARNVNFHLVSIQRSLKDVVLAETGAELDSAVAAMEKHEKHALREFEIIFKRYLGDREHINLAYQAVLEWKPIRNEVVALVRSGETRRAAMITRTRGEEHLVKLNDAVARMIEFASRKAEEFRLSAESKRSSGLRTIIIFSVAALLFTVLLLFLYLRRINDANRRMLRAHEWVDKILEAEPEATIVVDTQGHVLRANRTAVFFFGYSVDELASLKVGDLFPDNSGTEKLVLLSQFFAKPSFQELGQDGSICAQKKSGETVLVELSVGQAKIDDQIVAIANIRDVTERKQAEEKIFHQANYDQLTDLPNRALSLDRLSILITDAKRYESKVALLFVDLDDFKKINDTMGHQAGDELLVQASQRLKSSVRKGDTVGRMGGDEFIILLGSITNVVNVAPVADNILRKFREPFPIGDKNLQISTSIGVAVFPDDAQCEEELLRSADTAMYQSKEAGRNQFTFFTPEMSAEVARRFTVDEELRQALQREELAVFYQPKQDLDCNRISGFEALLRWNNNKLGPVSPAEFIPVAEQNGLIMDLGNYVLETALRDLATLRNELNLDLEVAVNVSPIQFRETGFVSLVEHILTQNKLSTGALEIEITEGVLLSGHGQIRDRLNDLRNIGVGLAMDDFGSGYSSLSYLRDYPFTVLKIDREFVNDVASNQSDQALVSAAISMAHGLGLKVVAEGVENEAQRAALKAMGCDVGQGYLFSRPLPVEEFRELLISEGQALDQSGQ